MDFFTPVVDDPFAFGQITAANALSDVYAMGGRPLLCMNILACPVKSMDNQVFRRIIEGGLDKIKEAGALLVGGHSIEDPELKYGLAVTGLVHPERLLRNSGARPGDALVLTKPLGTGILATALKGRLAEPGTPELLEHVMATLNRIPTELMQQPPFDRQELRPHSCTDITGFGLVGHLHEMAAASGVAMTIDLETLEFLPGTMAAINMGMVPEGATTNQRFYQQWVRTRRDMDDPLLLASFDPQTSGGLLIALPVAGARELVRAVAASDYPYSARIIGRVVEEKPGAILLQ